MAEPAAAPRPAGESVRVLIGEPFPEVRSLLERAVGRLGHEPVVHDGRWRERLPEVDVLVLEAELEDGLALAHALRRGNPELPVICTCSGEPGADVDALEPLAYLVKPFAIADLELALAAAAHRAVAGRPEQD